MSDQDRGPALYVKPEGDDAIGLIDGYRRATAEEIGAVRYDLLVGRVFAARIGALEIKANSDSDPRYSFLLGQDAKFTVDGEPPLDWARLTRVTIVFERDAPLKLTIEADLKPSSES